MTTNATENERIMMCPRKRISRQDAKIAKIAKGGK
jgi:hypothetical protein